MWFAKKKHLKIFARVLGLIMTFQCVFLNFSVVWANTGTQISYSINGASAVGNVIEILVNVSNVNNLYGGSLDLVYDNSIIEIQSVEKGSLFRDADVLIPVNKVSNGQINLAITHKGNSAGSSGSGTLAVIKAKVLKQGNINLKTTTDNGELSLDSNACRVKLANNESERINYTAQNENLEIMGFILKPGTYEESDEAISYTGGWTNETNDVYSNGFGKYSAFKGSSANFSFYGTGFELYVPSNEQRGIMNIYIDGKLVATPSQYSKKSQQDKLYYSVYGLDNGSHTVKVEVAGSKESNSKNEVVIFDRVVILGEESTILKQGTYEENNASITYTGGWTKEENPLYSNGSGIYSADTKGTINFLFSGTGLELYVPTNESRGKVNIYIDGKLVASPSQYSKDVYSDKLYYSIYGLENKNHVVKIEVAGSKEAASKSNVVIFDRVVILGDENNILKPGTYEEDNSGIAYSRGWTSEKHLDYSNGSGKYSSNIGSSVDFIFEGTGIELYVPTSEGRGIVNVYVDGKLVASPSQYSSEIQKDKMYYSISGLENKNHVVKIEVSGIKDGASKSNIVIFDRIVVLGDEKDILRPGIYEEDNSAIKYTNGWTEEENRDYSGNRGKYSSNRGSSVMFSFEGTGFELYIPGNNNRGKVNIYIDGKLVESPSQYTATKKANHKYYSIDGLENKGHLVKIEVAGSKEEASKSNVVIFDKLVIKNAYDDLLMPGTYEDNNSAMTYTGGWTEEQHSNYSDGSGKYSASIGSAVTFTFEGTGFELYVPSNASRGKVNVYIDGKLVASPSQYTSSQKLNNMYYSIDGLENKGHIVKVEVAGSKEEASNNNVIIFDKVVIKNAYNNVLQAGTYEENHSGITSTGGWTKEKNSSYSAGEGKYSAAAGSSVDFSFVGTGLELYVPGNKNRGKVNIFIDGNLVASPSQYTSTEKLNHMYYSIDGLANKVHTVKIEVAGNKEDASNSNVVIFDKVKIKNAYDNVLQPGTYEENNAEITYLGGWTEEKSSDYSRGMGKYSAAVGSSVDFSFVGTGIELFVPTSQSRGIVNIYIDEKLVASPSQYSQNPIKDKMYYSVDGLENIVHRVKIEVAGSKEAGSNNNVVIFDKVRIK